MSETINESVNNCFKIIETLEQSADKTTSNEVKVIVLQAIEFLKGMEKKAWIRTQRGKDACFLVKSNTEELKNIIQSGIPVKVTDQAKKVEESVSKMRREFEKSKWVVT